LLTLHCLTLIRETAFDNYGVLRTKNFQQLFFLAALIYKVL